MVETFDSDELVLWQLVAADGGWWTAKQLTQHMRPTYADFEVREHLESLTTRGYLERRDHPTQQALCGHQYGFTSSCSVLVTQPIPEGAPAPEQTIF